MKASIYYIKGEAEKKKKGRVKSPEATEATLAAVKSILLPLAWSNCQCTSLKPPSVIPQVNSLTEQQQQLYLAVHRLTS